MLVDFSFRCIFLNGVDGADVHDVCTLALLLHFVPNLFNKVPGKEEENTHIILCSSFVYIYTRDIGEHFSYLSGVVGRVLICLTAALIS